MSVEPIIAFGQQPCGFFPRRFLVAKIRTARRMQAEMGGRVVFFYHDSDHDPRETRTILRHRATGEPAQLNFAVVTKLQRKFSPLYVKRIAPDWHGKTARQLPNYVAGRVIDLFRKTSAETVADKPIGGAGVEFDEIAVFRQSWETVAPSMLPATRKSSRPSLS